ncbi:DUF6233 domain-containing protein [Streptomyces sp. NPDC093261]|uniref:DUF6233 domain-containing protein n=1 Tax=Streptomyces sp. NPDC093261 TaxID=3366037 RepID=UPI0037F4B317
MELGVGTGQPPVQVHSGDCRMAGKRRRAVGREEARRLLATGRGRTATVSPTPGCTSSTYRPRRRPGSAATPRNTRRCTPIPGSETEKPSFGWLTTDLSVYSSATLNLKTHVHTPPGRLAPPRRVRAHRPSPRRRTAHRDHPGNPST